MTLLKLLVLSCWVAGRASAFIEQQPSGDLTLEQYRDLIRLYRDGDFEWTVEELALASVETVDHLSRQLRKLAGERLARDKDLQAAVMLHSQVAITKTNEGDVLETCRDPLRVPNRSVSRPRAVFRRLPGSD